MHWIEQGKLLYADKMKIQTLIGQQRMTPAEVTYLNLDSVANIVENFENPKTIEESCAETLEQQHRPSGSYEDGDYMINGETYCVAIEQNRWIQDGGEILEVNDIRSIHVHDASNLIMPVIEKGTLVYADIPKGLNWLSSASINYQQEIDSQDLLSAAKIVENFENPKTGRRKLHGGVGAAASFVPFTWRYWPNILQNNKQMSSILAQKALRKGRVECILNEFTSGCTLFFNRLKISGLQNVLHICLVSKEGRCAVRFVTI